MSDELTAVNLSGQMEVEVPEKNTGPAFVHRLAVADAANSLLLALGGGPEAAGVVMLARALGCRIKLKK